MHYKVKGILIRSENAARSMYQASRYLLNWIDNYPQVKYTLDYGCGKLRYSGSLAKKCNLLTLVDSEIQLNRVQRLGNEKTTVYEYISKHLPNVRVLTINQFLNDNEVYDFILCANVLSAIPSRKSRGKMLCDLKNSLNNNAECLFVTQYVNSYFKQLSLSPNSIRHLDGWIHSSSRGNSYYGILDKNKINNILKRHKYRIIKSWINSQSAYVLAK